MDRQHEPNFYYLNREKAWLDFQSAGLDLLPDGAWQLAALPRLAGRLPENLRALPAPTGPAGIALDPCGAVYFSQPESATLGVIEPCEGIAIPADCLPGEGGLPGWLNQPRGLLYHPERGALFVADSGNNRIQIFDPGTWQVVDIWGRSGSPGAGPWNLDTPWSLASDQQGNVYVADVPDGGTARVLKFDLYGRPQPNFWETARDTAGLQHPIAVAAGTFAGEDCIFVLDDGLNAVVALCTDGRLVTQFGSSELQDPLVLAAGDDVIYVGDNARRQVLVFKPLAPQSTEFAYVGSALGYQGPVAALAIDARGSLWLHPGWQDRPLRLDLTSAYARHGALWGGPFGSGLRAVRWHRLKAAMTWLGTGAHVQFFAFGGDDPSTPPPPPDGEGNFDVAAGWRPLPLDADDALIPPPSPVEPSRDSLPPSPDLAALAKQINAIPKERYLWVGAQFTGDGLSSPRLQQVRIDYDHTTYRQHLPAIFSREPAQADLLDRLLSLYESHFEEPEQQIRDLALLFDPDATPASWLPWLAGWVGLDLIETWPESIKRGAIQHAIESYGRRGTATGLREAIELYAGVQAHVDEPVLGTDWWALAPDDADDLAGRDVAVLGFTTRLAPGEPDGAVLGGNAVLDGSTLIGAEDYGAPLFEEVAHQFTVQIYRGQLEGEPHLEQVRATIEREKPAHTTYHLCVIEPRMRVGFQARLGIDTVVAGPLQPTPFDGGDADGLVLGGEEPGQIGVQSQVGRTTRLTNHSLQ